MSWTLPADEDTDRVRLVGMDVVGKQTVLEVIFGPLKEAGRYYPPLFLRLFEILLRRSVALFYFVFVSNLYM